MVKTVEQYGKDLMNAVNSDVMLSVHNIMFNRLKGVKVGEFGSRVDAMAEDLEKILSKTLQKYIGIKIEDLPEEQRRDIRGNFVEVFEKSYEEFNNIIRSDAGQELLSPHNELRSEKGEEKLQNLEELINIDTGGDYIRRFARKSSNGSLCTNPAMEVLLLAMDVGDVSIRKERSAIKDSAAAAKEYRKKTSEIILGGILKFFKSIGDFLCLTAPEQGESSSLIQDADAHVRKELGADVTAAKAIKMSTSAALGEMVELEGGVHRLDSATTKNLAERAGVKLKKQGSRRAK